MILLYSFDKVLLLLFMSSILIVKPLLAPILQPYLEVTGIHLFITALSLSSNVDGAKLLFHLDPFSFLRIFVS